jgi:hypothetical protein
MPREPEPDRVPSLRLAHAEIERDRESYARRLQAIDSRAGVLVAASAIATGVRAAVPGNGWGIVAVIAALVAAILGVVALMPAKNPVLKPEEYRRRLLSGTEAEGLLYLLDHKVYLQASSERRLTAKSRLLQVGFAFLVSSIACSLLTLTGVQIRIN